MGMDRLDLRFDSSGEACAAWLYLPVTDAAAPVAVLAHGLHRGFGDSAGEPDRFEPARQLQDWRAAIAFARSLPEIDADRVATFGSSIGGGNALAAAAEDPRVKAAISQVPVVDLRRQAHRSPPEVAAQLRAAAETGGHLPAVGQPYEAAFINAPGSEAGWRHVVAIGEDSRWRNRVSASWLLGQPYRPARQAATLHCPVAGAPAAAGCRISHLPWAVRLVYTPSARPEGATMERDNKAIVQRWFTEFWGNPWNPGVIDELAAPDIRFEYSMHKPRRGRDEVRAFATEFRAAFPDLNFWGTADLIAEGDYVIGQWEGGGTHTGEAFSDLPVGALPAGSGKTMRFTGISVLRVENGMITEELGLDDGVTVLKQLELIPAS
jgi:predicted ester cyclase